MRMLKKKSKFQNDLLKANRETQKLGELLERESQVRAQAVDFLAAILISRHSGTAEIHPEEIQAAKGMMMKAEGLPNGAVRVVLMTAEEFLKSTPATPITQAIEEKLLPSGTQGENGGNLGGKQGEAYPEPEEPSTICEFAWHRDPNAMGVLCPECGSGVREELAVM